MVLRMMLGIGELTTDVGNVIFGGEAVNCGSIDAPGRLSDTLEYIHGKIALTREKSDCERIKDMVYYTDMNDV